MNDHSTPGLDGLDRAATSPPELKGRVLGTLHSRGLLQPRPRQWVRGAAALAASLALFALGVAAGRRSGHEPPRDHGSQYLLLLYGRDSSVTDADRASRVQEYTDWARELRRDDRLEMGEELSDSAAFVRPGDAPAVTVPVPGGEAGALVGFFVIRAADGEEAFRVARTNPHLRHGGSIVIRPIRPT